MEFIKNKLIFFGKIFAWFLVGHAIPLFINNSFKYQWDVHTYIHVLFIFITIYFSATTHLKIHEIVGVAAAGFIISILHILSVDDIKIWLPISIITGTVVDLIIAKLLNQKDKQRKI